ncbi:MAG: hypothetical protein QNJ81_14440 [Acidimicrobiia bacterium]|nr:hypothetical protein [Acidimicrobiia bacterium]
MSSNPLAAYFRRPSIYVNLPSQGQFYMPPLNANPQEVPIFPMTAIDEITYKTPDALFNGEATADVIKSCIPAIQDPWSMPVIDLTSALVGIRIASFGHEMIISTQCPACKEVADYGIDLREVLASVGVPDYSEPLSAGDLKIYFRPLNYREMNNNSRINFEEQRLTRSIESDPDLEDDAKMNKLAEAFRKVSIFTIETLAKNIDRIEIADTQTVTDHQFILEYLHSCDRDVYNEIKAHVVEQRSKTELKPLDIKCDACGHEYQQPYTLDMANFFE